MSSEQVLQSIQSLNGLITNINRDFDVASLRDDLMVYINALKKDKENVRRLTQKIEDERKAAPDAAKLQGLQSLYEEANKALVLSTSELEKYKATLQFLKTVGESK